MISKTDAFSDENQESDAIESEVELTLDYKKMMRMNWKVEPCTSAEDELFQIEGKASVMPWGGSVLDVFEE